MLRIAIGGSQCFASNIGEHVVVSSQLREDRSALHAAGVDNLADVVCLNARHVPESDALIRLCDGVLTSEKQIGLRRVAEE